MDDIRLSTAEHFGFLDAVGCLDAHTSRRAEDHLRVRRCHILIGSVITGDSHLYEKEVVRQ